MKEYQLFIDNEYVSSASGTYSDDLNPATGEVYAKVQNAGKDDVERILASSAKAFETWKDVSPSAREKLLLNAASLMEERAKELAEVLIEEAGSTLLKAGYETHHTPTFLRSMAGEVRRVKGETYLSDYPGVKSYCIRRPLGTVLSIAPLYFRMLLVVRKIGFALAVVKSCIHKPSVMAPVIGLNLAELFLVPAVPPSVLKVVPAVGAEHGDGLTTEYRVKFISF